MLSFIPRKICRVVLVKFVHTARYVCQCVCGSVIGRITRQVNLEDRGQSQWTIVRMAMNLYIALLTFRYLAFGFRLSINSVDYVRYDLLLSVKRKFFYFNRTTSLSFALLTALAVYVEHLFRDRVNCGYFQMCYDLFVLNPSKFWSLNRLHVQVTPRRPFQCIRQLTNSITDLWNSSEHKVRFAHSKLKNFPKISNVIRVRAIMMCQACELLVTANNAISAVAFALRFWLHLRLAMRTFPLNRSTLFAIDLCINYCAQFVVAEKIWYIVFTLTSICLVFSAQLRHLSIYMSNASMQISTNALEPMQYAARLHYYRTVHSMIATKLDQLNSDVISNVLLALVCCFLPSNVYQITLLLFVKINSAGQSMDRASLWVMLVLQTPIAMICAIALAHVSSHLHHSGRYLHRSQIHLCSQNHSASLLRNKLKQLTYYELVHTKQRFHFTIGPLASISKPFILDVSEC